ncbi:hypothetical protein QBC35DRAFT_131515 [Podospora australis]|uniref:MARVEL domain-containing protein n=1 Tax=Podospora australis TaxID=1536484 RepID=A0AAN6WJH5_9PEZI|nr:hypothetical protein QBC35DRAFT_131515 [Podospora australis]
MSSAHGLIARGVPPQPLWLLYIKIAILVLSLILLAMGAWAVSIFSGGWYGYSGGAGGMVIFVTIFSFLVYGGAAAVELWAQHLFYRIAFFIGYILSIIFWLSAWAWSASSASVWLGYSWKGTEGHKEGQALAVCAGLGAVVWILTIVHLAFFIQASLADPQGAPASQAELGNVKHNEVPPAGQQYPQQPYPAQQQYTQQPYATQ